jgi:hypothetical protein
MAPPWGDGASAGEDGCGDFAETGCGAKSMAMARTAKAITDTDSRKSFFITANLEFNFSGGVCRGNVGDGTSEKLKKKLENLEFRRDESRGFVAHLELKVMKVGGVSKAAAPFVAQGREPPHSKVGKGGRV